MFKFDINISQFVLLFSILAFLASYPMSVLIEFNYLQDGFCLLRKLGLWLLKIIKVSLFAQHSNLNNFVTFREEFRLNMSTLP